MEAEGSIVSRSARVCVEWEVCGSPITVCSLTRAEESNGNNKKAASRERSMLDTRCKGLGKSGVNVVTVERYSGNHATVETPESNDSLK